MKHTTSRQIVLATGNQGKVQEMQSTLVEFGFEVLAQSQFDFSEAIEDGLSFVENALIKARHACQNTGLPAIADDSGLEVSALNGAPGIYSSRYATEDDSELNQDQLNIQKLLRTLDGVDDRQARFQCVIVYMQHALDPTPIICQGTWEGSIALRPSGENGFGYDPVFYVSERHCHAAELTPSDKKKLSHRGKALVELKQQLGHISSP